MIYNDDAYYHGYYRNVRTLGAIPALVFDTIAGLLRNSDGIGEISNGTLCDLLGITERQLRPVIAKLIEIGYVEKKNGDGRGNKSIYYITEKGYKNVPLYNQKRVTNLSKKGNIFVAKGLQNGNPLNTVLNKELNKESGGVLRDAQSPTLSITTPQNFENMEDFNEFWNLYPEAKNYPQEKESCERVWSLMQKEWREKLVQQLRDGKRWRPAYGNDRDNPVWYLRNYAGQDVETELPFMRPGTVKFEKWCNETWKAGKKIALIRYAGSLAYCQMEDLQTMQSAGAEYLREFVEYKD